MTCVDVVREKSGKKKILGKNIDHVLCFIRTYLFFSSFRNFDTMFHLFILFLPLMNHKRVADLGLALGDGVQHGGGAL